jgi:hypothetical protein
VDEMRFDTDVGIFLEYLDGIKGSSEGQIQEIVIEYTPEGLSCSAKNPENTRFVTGILPKSLLKNYEGTPEDFLSTGNMSKFMDYLKRFKKDVSIYVEKNRILIKSGDKEAFLVMPDKDYIKSTKLTKVIPYTHKFEIDASIFHDAISNAGVVGKDAIHEIGIKDGQLYVCSGDKTMDYFVEKTKVEGVGNIKSYFKSGFDSLFSSAEGKLKVSMMEGGPMQTYYEKGGMKFTNICSPFMAEEEKETEVKK